MSLPDPGNINNTANWEYVRQQLTKTPLQLPLDVQEFLRIAGFEKPIDQQIQILQQEYGALSFSIADAIFKEYLDKLSTGPNIPFPAFCIKLFDFAYQVYDLYNNGLERDTISINDKTNDVFASFTATAKVRIYHALHIIQDAQIDLTLHNESLVRGNLEIAYPILDRLQMLLKIGGVNSINKSERVTFVPYQRGASVATDALIDLVFYKRYIENTPENDEWLSESSNKFYLQLKDHTGVDSCDELFMIDLLRLQAKVVMLLAIANPLRYINSALYICNPNDHMLRAKILNDFGNTAIWFATLASLNNKKGNEALIKKLLKHPYGIIANTVFHTPSLQNGRAHVEKNVPADVNKLILLAANAFMRAKEDALHAQAGQSEQYSLAEYSLKRIEKFLPKATITEVPLKAEDTLPAFRMLKSKLSMVPENESDDDTDEEDKVGKHQSHRVQNGLI